MSPQTPHPTSDRDLRRWLAAHRIVVRGLTLADHIGSPRATREIESLAAMLREPDEVVAAGGALIRGVLLSGPPGVGKTHLARILGSILGESVPFYECSAAELTERRVGTLARYFAAHPAPAVLYIDEIDAVALERGSRIHDRRSRGVLYATPVRPLDGLRDGGRLLYVASTNTDPAFLDRSLLRSGRFGRTVRLELPTLAERQAIFAYHAARRTLAEPIDYARAAELTQAAPEPTWSQPSMMASPSAWRMGSAGASPGGIWSSRSPERARLMRSSPSASGSAGARQSMRARTPS